MKKLPSGGRADRLRDESFGTPAAIATDTFLGVVRRSPMFQAAMDLRPDRVQRELQGLARGWDLQIDIDTASFLDVLVSTDSDTISGDGHTRWRLKTDASESDAHRRALAIHVEEEESERSVSVAPPDLEELDFETIQRICVRHPLRQLVPQFAARGKPLTEVIADLARIADADFAIQSNAASAIEIDVFLRNRPVCECLRTAAAAANWHVLIDGELNWTGRDETFGLQQVADALSTTWHTPSSGLLGNEPSAGTPFGALREMLECSAARLKRDTHLIVVRSEPAAATKA